MAKDNSGTFLILALAAGAVYMLMKSKNAGGSILFPTLDALATYYNLAPLQAQDMYNDGTILKNGTAYYLAGG